MYSQDAEEIFRRYLLPAVTMVMMTIMILMRLMM